MGEEGLEPPEKSLSGYTSSALPGKNLGSPTHRILANLAQLARSIDRNDIADALEAIEAK